MRTSSSMAWSILGALVALLCSGVRATAEEDVESRFGRFHVTEVARESHGGWTVRVVRVSDRWTRALRVTTRLVRTGPGELAEDPRRTPHFGGVLVPLARSGDVPFRLHERGWMVVGGRGAARLHGPGDATGVERPDLDLSPLSRFPASGFLSVGMRGEQDEASLRIAWAPLTPSGLGPAVEVVRIPAARMSGPLPEAAVRVTGQADGVEIDWLVPGKGGHARGRARVTHPDGTIAPLPIPEAPATIRVAAVQSPSGLGEVPQNLERLSRLVDDAARAGAKLVVLPETAITGYLSQDLKTTWHVPGRPKDDAFPHGRDPHGAAEAVPGTSTRLLGALAAHWGIWLTAPLVEVVEEASERRYFNTVVLMGPDGRQVGHYRKLSPWPHPEQSWATEGDLGLANVETPYGRLGLAICFDVHSVFERYGAQPGGLWTLLYPIAWVSEGGDAEWFGKELPARAKAAGFHVVGANWSLDETHPWHGHGFSTIIARDGRVLAQAKTRLGTEIVLADLPLSP